MTITVLFSNNSLYDSSYNSIYDSPGIMVVGGHDAFFTYDSSYNSYYDSFYNSCYLYSESPPVKLVLITEEGIQRQLSEMKINHGQTQVSS